ncbi:hypothetical protein SESBI_35642 [Sesbania bispinosa]|nr:hypothetical protein SESBI_35642 [Sesbania bispinosa]
MKIPAGSLLAYLLESGILVNLLRREMGPKDLCLYPDEVIVTNGSHEFMEYSTLRSWVRQWLNYVKWYRKVTEGSKRPSSLGVLWYPRVRYCFDENNELFSQMDMASFEKEVIPNDPTPVRVLTSGDWVNLLKEQGKDEYLS